jgi:hypothetical protein
MGDAGTGNNHGRDRSFSRSYMNGSAKPNREGQSR